MNDLVVCDRSCVVLKFLSSLECRYRRFLTVNANRKFINPAWLFWYKTALSTSVPVSSSSPSFSTLADLSPPLFFLHTILARCSPQTTRYTPVMDRKRGSRSDSPHHKRQKLTHDTARPSPLTTDADGANKLEAGLCAENLATGLLHQENVERLRQEYAHGEPYKHARIETLFQDDLLRKVKDECLTHLVFTEKETDIYRVSCVHYPIYDLAARSWGLRVVCPSSSHSHPSGRFSCFFFSHEVGPS